MDEPDVPRGEEVVVAVDVGGTVMKCALVDETGKMRHTERRPTGRERGPNAAIEEIIGVATALADRARVDGLRPVGLGVVVPGVVDEERGVAVLSANLGWRDVPLRGLAEKWVGLPAALGHDVRAGGLAEARLGAGQRARHLLFVAIGTGIAAAQVTDGAAYAGAHGAAGELGHVVVRPGGPACGCGGRGCLEAVASAAAIAREYAERTGRTATADEVAARSGEDPAAAAVWAGAVDALADGLLTGIALVDPEIVVVGGGLAEAGDVLFEPLTAALRGKITFHREPRVLPAALGDEAGCLGAALLAWRRLDTSVV